MWENIHSMQFPGMTAKGAAAFLSVLRKFCEILRAQIKIAFGCFALLEFHLSLWITIRGSFIMQIADDVSATAQNTSLLCDFFVAKIGQRLKILRNQIE